MTKISFVIPCYNSKGMLGAVTDEITQVMAQAKDYGYEIILVNDSSPDDLFPLIEELANSDPHIKGIDLSKNFGQHAAIMAGLNCAGGDIIVCLDDDGQTPACEVFSLIEKLNAGCDIVFANYDEKKHSVFRNFGSKINDIMARWLIQKPKALKLTSYFACRRFIAEEMIQYNNPYPYISGLLLRTSNKIANVPVSHRPRLQGESGYSVKKLLSLWFNGFTAFSVKPLRLAVFFGVLCAFFGFIYGCYIIINKFINPATPLGYSSTMAVILFIGGVIMLILGMLGEYIGRIYISLNNSPQYLVRKTVNIAREKKTGEHNEFDEER